MSNRGYAVSEGDAKKYRDGWDQTFGDKKPKRENVYACPECGCEDIEGTAWIHLNSGNETGGEPPDDDYFCPDCELREGDGHVRNVAMFDRNDPDRKNTLTTYPEFVPVPKKYRVVCGVNRVDGISLHEANTFALKWRDEENEALIEEMGGGRAE